LLDYYPSCRNEKLGIDKNILFIPKAFCFISQKPLFSLHAKLLQLLFQKTIRNKHYEYLPNKNMNEFSVQISENLVNEYKTLINKHKEKKAEVLWHNKYQEIYSKYANENKFININEANLLEFYLSLFFELPFVNEQYTLYKIMGLGRKEENNLEYVSYQNGELNLNNYRTLFKKCKKIENLLRFCMFVLLEKQIIVFGEDNNEIVCVLEAIMELISPMY
jgi:DENN (AEX-3) domain